MHAMKNPHSSFKAQEILLFYSIYLSLFKLSYFYYMLCGEKYLYKSDCDQLPFIFKFDLGLFNSAECDIVINIHVLLSS